MAKDNRINPAMADQLSKVASNTPERVEEAIDAMLTDQAAHLTALKAVGYGAVDCSAADGDVSERFGRKSCPVIEVAVPIPALGIKLTGTIWGRLVNGTDGTTVTFEAGMPKGVKHMDAAGKERLLAHMENGAAAWPGYDKATDAASAKLTGQTAGTVGARPKLVKRIVMTGTVNQPQA